MEVIAQEGKQEAGLRAVDAAGPEGGLAALIDELSHGILLTTEHGRLVHANQAARHELVRAKTIALWEGALVQACRPECDRELQTAISRAATGRRSLVHLAALEGPGLAIAVVPTKHRPADEPRCALVLSRATVTDALMLGFFSRRYAITPAEQQVLGKLCEGMSAPRIATDLGVAVSTIRSHVRSICAKTRSSGVREVVRRIAVLPPVAPAFPHEARR